MGVAVGTGAAARAAVERADYPVAPCARAGPTASDQRLAGEIGPRLTGRLAGGLDAYAVSCARQIVAGVRARGLPPRAAVIAVTTAIVETDLRNISVEVDHDSLGLFQQRASWGTAAQRLDPGWATGAFLDRMLATFPNGSWSTAPVGRISQAVQISAFPDRYQPEAEDAATIAAALNGATGDAVGGSGAPAVAGDADGDGKTDRALWDPAGGAWSVWATSTGKQSSTATLGRAGDLPLRADVDGDGRADPVVWRPSSGQWLRPAGVLVTRGQAGDVPAAADYDGDGRVDLAVWSPPTGTWLGVPGGAVTLGRSGDVPVPGDYDGDGRAEPAVWRPTTGEWFVRSTASGGDAAAPKTRVPGDAAVVGDYDGDGRADLAVWHAATATYSIRLTASGAVRTVAVGKDGDVPVAGDFDGDGKYDPASWQPSTGRWSIRFSSTGALADTGIWGKAPAQPPR
jgi:hypothetical protein